ncbi:glutamate-1-semialdehyde 2,1-aminomutase [Chlamydia muridarum str. Nigg]|uniref:Glutamate-1-semialdehyde 2,1-aminomutase n=2 Tax=Chlamydia muridarum TaxID=83560 RepID=GSA_CHLMU|nr:glutamate-1-semialdehyde 2,1-aminomutase [Chlamydia muridarum]Q9PKI3.1 RecName: Full=Glutamate-1-semialdehyde 2,1-aminomutase; Short=GSA; AltName: Full=Glutamate-1-semialdehyde aminotransferase; Short=GSA-AT [Chlamydia muridarum str. Nigg]UFW99737.1 glutamate-1-semialdehyde 2,1-aminomutase [Chlamydia trachomatis]AAF39328.1 glutamate-1-semialdehyde 2,1-aminomutase [Chlamydia muridarum str. Nigg]AHH22869.1 glutamate-1-semialdehyde aminotransferase [Chlamydia muridarum str. Nigg3 CMUT3-5]AHH23
MPHLFSKACQYFPGGVNSPVRACRSVDITPPVVTRASGDFFTDSQGKTYIDFCGSWGSLIHGHSHPYICEAIQQGLQRGCSYGLTSEQEISFAEEIFSYLEISNDHKIRFMSTGSEATMTAVRLARGVTERPIIIKFSGCYHGHSDVFLQEIHFQQTILDTVDLTQPLTLSLPFNNLSLFLDVMNQIGHRVAGVIFEPICANMGVVLPLPGFIEGIIQTCRKTGSLSIMDEVVTGFRVSKGGAAALHPLKPDILVFGKILGGGLPASAVCAPAAIMDYLAPVGKVFQAGTLSGNPLAMSAGKASIALCREKNFYTQLSAIEDDFLSPIEQMIQQSGIPVTLVRYGNLFSFFFSENRPNNLKEVQLCNTDIFRTFYQQAFLKGIYLSPSPFEASFLSTAHSMENLNYAQQVLIESLEQACSLV